LPSTTRRALLASAGGAAAVALAGCSAPSRTVTHRFEQWTPASLFSDRFRRATYVDAARIRERDIAAAAPNDAALLGWPAYREPPGLDSGPQAFVDPEVDPESVDWWLWVGGSGRPPSGVVAEGDFDVDGIADRLASGEWLEVSVDGTFRAFQHRGRRVVAVSDNRLLSGRCREGADPTETVRAFQQAAGGDGRYAASEPAFGALCDAIGDSVYANLSSVTDPFPETRIDRGLFEGLVTRGVGASVEHGEVHARFPVVFADGTDMPVDAVREWARRLDAFDWTRVDTAGRTVTVVAGAPVEAVPASAYSWAGLRARRN
jgi:hypothetical protein